MFRIGQGLFTVISNDGHSQLSVPELFWPALDAHSYTYL